MAWRCANTNDCGRIMPSNLKAYKSEDLRKGPICGKCHVAERNACGKTRYGQLLHDQLRQAGFRIHDVAGDGSCLFRALAHQLYGHDRGHITIRSEVVSYLARNPSLIHLDVGQSVDSFLEDLRRVGTFGDENSIAAFCQIHHVNVHVHILSQPPEVFTSNGQGNLRNLNVCFVNGNHFTSLVAVGQNDVPGGFPVSEEDEFSDSPPSNVDLPMGKSVPTTGEIEHIIRQELAKHVGGKKDNRRTCSSKPRQGKRKTGGNKKGIPAKKPRMTSQKERTIPGGKRGKPGKKPRTTKCCRCHESGLGKFASILTVLGLVKEVLSFGLLVWNVVEKKDALGLFDRCANLFSVSRDTAASQK